MSLLDDLVRSGHTGLHVGGAWRESSDGIGREGSHHGVMEFLEPKYIGSDW